MPENRNRRTSGNRGSRVPGNRDGRIRGSRDSRDTGSKSGRATGNINGRIPAIGIGTAGQADPDVRMQNLYGMTRNFAGMMQNRSARAQVHARCADSMKKRVYKNPGERIKSLTGMLVSLKRKPDSSNAC